MLKIDFKKKTVSWDCPNGHTTILPFDKFKENGHSIACGDCNTSYSAFLGCFVINHEWHDDPQIMQADKDIWELNKQYHILRRILEHGKKYEEVKDEPDLYMQVHKKVGKEMFAKVWREHESETKHMSEYLKNE